MTNGIDPSTGLPELPEGYFWRVSQNVLHTNKVELRKKLLLGSRVIDSRVAKYYAPNKTVLNPPDEILRCARSIMSEFQDPWKEYLGGYPPKKLEV